MWNWKLLVIGIGCFLIYRIIHNLTRLISIKKLYSDYQEYLKNPQYSFSQKVPRIIKLFNNAEIENFTVSKFREAGYGRLRKSKIKGFSNVAFTDPEFVPKIHGKFHEARGVFKGRIWETINPLFWIEFVLKLPTYILEFLGLKSGNVLSKVLQIIYWIVGIVYGLEQLGIISILGTVKSN